MPIKAKRLLTEIQSYVKAKLCEYWLKVPKSRATGRKIVSKKRKTASKKPFSKANRQTETREILPDLEDRAVVESWNGRPRRFVKSYFQSLCKISIAKKAESTALKVVSRFLKSKLTKRTLNNMVQSVANLKGSTIGSVQSPMEMPTVTRNERKTRSSSKATTNGTRISNNNNPKRRVTPKSSLPRS